MGRETNTAIPSEHEDWGLRLVKSASQSGDNEEVPPIEGTLFSNFGKDKSKVCFFTDIKKYTKKPKLFKPFILFDYRNQETHICGHAQDGFKCPVDFTVEVDHIGEKVIGLTAPRIKKDLAAVQIDFLENVLRRKFSRVDAIKAIINNPPYLLFELVE